MRGRKNTQLNQTDLNAAIKILKEANAEYVMYYSSEKVDYIFLACVFICAVGAYTKCNEKYFIEDDSSPVNAASFFKMLCLVIANYLTLPAALIAAPLGIFIAAEEPWQTKRHKHELNELNDEDLIKVRLVLDSLKINTRDNVASIPTLLKTLEQVNEQFFNSNIGYKALSLFCNRTKSLSKEEIHKFSPAPD